jgi:hypothetical protein
MKTLLFLLSALLMPMLTCESHDRSVRALSTRAKAVATHDAGTAAAKTSAAVADCAVDCPSPAKPISKPASKPREPRPTRPNYLLM